MIKIDTHPLNLTYPDDSYERLTACDRLIVLVPANTDHRAAAQHIWRLANTPGRHVCLLSVCRDAKDEPGLHRELVTMSSLLQGSGVVTEIKVDVGTTWVDAVKTLYRKGDMIVCFAEQSTRLLRRPLRQVLEADIKATVYILPALTLHKSGSSNQSQIGAWLGFISIIVGFAVLQASIVQFPTGWLQNILLILSILPEFWLILVWNGLFS